MGNVFQLPVIARPVPPSLASLATGLAGKTRKLEAAIATIGTCIKTCEQFVHTIEDTVARERFQQEARRLHDQLLLASIELVRLNLACVTADRYGAGSDALTAAY